MKISVFKCNSYVSVKAFTAYIWQPDSAEESSGSDSEEELAESDIETELVHKDAKAEFIQLKEKVVSRNTYFHI